VNCTLESEEKIIAEITKADDALKGVVVTADDALPYAVTTLQFGC
jgi:hypothetical protein